MSGLPSALFSRPLPGLARPLTDREGEQLLKYLNILTKWQKTQRLIGSVEPSWITENVFAHSLCFLEVLPASIASLADLGSGAGLPGVPIAIVKPELRITLIEARQRRASFLSTVVRELELHQVEVVGKRAEDLSADYEGRFDAVAMRCAGEIKTMLASARRLLKAGGVVVASAHPTSKPEPGSQEVVVRAPSGVLRTFRRYGQS